MGTKYSPSNNAGKNEKIFHVKITMITKRHLLSVSENMFGIMELKGLLQHLNHDGIVLQQTSMVHSDTVHVE